MRRIPDEASNSTMSDNIIAAPALPAKTTSRSDIAGRVVSNVILLSLPEKEYEMLAPHVEHLDLPQHKLLHEAGRKIDYTYFLNDGMASLVAVSRDGRSVEVGIVGKEGMVGMPLTAGPVRAGVPARKPNQRSGSPVRAQGLLRVLRRASCTARRLTHLC